MRKQPPFTYDERKRNYEILRQEYDKSLTIYIAIFVAILLLGLEMIGEFIKYYFIMDNSKLILIKLLVLSLLLIVFKKWHYLDKHHLTFLSGIVWKNKRK